MDFGERMSAMETTTADVARQLDEIRGDIRSLTTSTGRRADEAASTHHQLEIQVAELGKDIAHIGEEVKAQVAAFTAFKSRMVSIAIALASVSIGGAPALEKLVNLLG